MKIGLTIKILVNICIKNKTIKGVVFCIQRQRSRRNRTFFIEPHRYKMYRLIAIALLMCFKIT